MQYVYGWNIPGYSPDFVSEEACDWREAVRALEWEVARWDEDDDMSAEQLDAAEFALKTVVGEPRPLDLPCGKLNLFVAPAEG